MLAFWKKAGRGQGHDDDADQEAYSPFSGSPELARHRAVGQARGHDDYEERSPRFQEQGPTSYFDNVRYRNNEDDEEEPDGDAEEEDDDDDDEDNDNDDEDAIDTPLLPIFSAAHLDRLPMYNITHAIRLLIVARADPDEPLQPCYTLRTNRKRSSISKGRADEPWQCGSFAYKSPSERAAGHASAQGVHGARAHRCAIL
jgi:hypothetical protein